MWECLLEITEAALMRSPAELHKRDLKKDYTSRNANMGGGSSQGLNPRQKPATTKVFFPREVSLPSPNCLSSVKRSVLKTYIQVTVYGLNRLYLCV